MYIHARHYVVLNRFLLTAIIGLGLYIALAPLVPEVEFQLAHSTLGTYWRSLFGSDTISAPLVVTPRHAMNARVTVVPVVPEADTLSIPQIGVFAPIIEGPTARAMEMGVWHRPGTGDPVVGGNMVLVGHRFLYTSGPKTFYHLDKVAVGDILTVYWQKQAYRYEVESVLVTQPDAVEIEQASSTPLLTVYTCTPLFTVDKRLVIRAHALP